MAEVVNIAALDLSLTGTGIAHLADGTLTARTVKCPKLIGNARLDLILRTCVYSDFDADLVVIEGPAYGKQSKQSGHHERAGLWWLVAHALWVNSIPYVVIPPSNRSKYATGKGTAGKDEVMAAAIKRYGHLVDITDNNQGDAVVLLAMVADHYGAPLAKVPQLNAKALEEVTWLELGTNATV